MKLETITFEYEHCVECPHIDSTWVSSKSKVYCTKVNPERQIKRDELWVRIPDWCPLQNKLEEGDNVDFKEESKGT